MLEKAACEPASADNYRKLILANVSVAVRKYPQVARLRSPVLAS